MRRGPESSVAAEPVVLRFAGRCRTQLSEMSCVVVFGVIVSRASLCILLSFVYNYRCFMFAAFCTVCV